jgi:hypothetical protein
MQAMFTQKEHAASDKQLPVHHSMKYEFKLS